MKLRVALQIQTQTLTIKSIANILYFKLAAIVILALLLLIPTAMTESLIHERQWNRQSAVEEVSSTWGQAQTIAGPFLSIPYTRKIVSQTDKGATVISQQRERLHLLPENLNINGNLAPQIRKRSIYEVPVYTAHITMEGSFTLPDLSTLDLPLDDLKFDKQSWYSASLTCAALKSR